MTGWKADLADFFRKEEAATTDAGAEVSPAQEPVEAFLTTVVVAAFEQIKAELEGYGRNVHMNTEWNSASIVVRHNREVELDYSVNVRTEAQRAFPTPVIRAPDRGDGQMYTPEG